MVFWRWILTGLIGLASVLTPNLISTRQDTIPPIPNLRFEHLTVDQGLSNSEIMAILQDSSGYLWFGTQNGLNRYDGYTFTTFHHNSEDPRSLSSNVVLAAAESPDGSLWFGTDSGGLNRYDPTTGRFTAYQHDPRDPSSLSNNAVWSLLVDREGFVWAGTRGGLSRLDPQTGLFSHYEPNPGDSQPLSKWVLRIYEDRAGALWVGTRMGLNRLDRATGEFTVYRPDVHNPGAISSEQAWAIYEDSRGTLWVGTRGGGLNRYDPTADAFTAYQHDPANPDSLSHNTVWDIVEDPSGDLWIGTEGGGLNRLDVDTMRFTAYRADPNDPYTLTSDDTFRLVLDRGGVLWIGSRVGGVNKLYPAMQRFAHYRHIPGSPNSLSVNFASGMLAGAGGVLWAGTRGGGLNRIDLSTGQVTAYRANPTDSNRLSHDFVYNIVEDEAGLLWLTTSGGGLNRFDPATGRFQSWKSDPQDPSGLLSNYVNVILPAGDGQFWLGTLGFGLEKFDPATGKATHYRYNADDPHSLSEDTINAILPDGAGGLWVGTFRGGLNHFDPATGRFTRYQHDPDSPTSLSDNNVQSLFIDHAGTLWVGTLTGLNRFDPRTGTFAHYHTSNGLPSESVYCIQEDNLEQLWLGTGRGLARFDPLEGSFATFGPEDGLQSSQFFQYACAKGADGRLYFGGPNGINAFRPEALVESRYAPPVALTRLLLFNQPLLSGSPALARPVDQLNELRLNHDQNVITFEFAALNYQNTVKNLYQYRMVGFDKDWSPPGSRRQATYTNLAPGEYTFQVRASNHDGVWTGQPRSLRVVILPPWWQTGTFMAGMIGLVLALLVGGVQARLRSVHAHNQALEHRVRERTQALIAANDQLTAEIQRRAVIEGDLRQAKEAAEAANQAKTVFLATMSHELRTPLHVILGYADLIARQPALPDSEREQLGAIGRSGEHLLTLINDVLDLSKIEAGRMEINANPFDLHHMLRDLEEMFRLRADQKGLDLCFEPSANLPRLVHADEVRLRQMLINLIGNAVKFTDSGKVTVHAWADETPAPPPARPGLAGAPSTEDEPGQGGAPGAPGFTIAEPALQSEDPREAARSLRLAFQIADTGPGIAADELPHLFQNFSQARAGRRTRQGTGLGLALVARFASMMGGRVSVQSELGRGSVFTFTIQATLPFTGADEPDLQAAFAVDDAAPADLAAVPSPPGLPALRLLVVDDEPDNREMLLTVLRPLGFELREAADGRQALELWEEWQPHLIWLDMRMPVMDGYETARAIRARSATQTRIVALSASAQGEEHPRILAAGCDAALLKPVRAQEIYDCLAAQLGLPISPPPVPALPADSGPADGQQPSTESPAAHPAQPQPARPARSSAAPLPPELAADLIYAAQRTDPRRILALIERVREKNPTLAALLTGLVKQYNYEAILNVLTSTLPTKPRANWPTPPPEERE